MWYMVQGVEQIGSTPFPFKSSFTEEVVSYVLSPSIIQMGLMSEVINGSEKILE